MALTVLNNIRIRKFKIMVKSKSLYKNNFNINKKILRIILPIKRVSKN